MRLEIPTDKHSRYRARKAYAKELKSYSLSELELEHQKLRNPHPPSYDDIFKNASSSESSREASLHVSNRPYSRSSSSASS